MPRYLIERSFAEGLHIPTSLDGVAACADVVSTNSDHGVTWLHSYVSPDKSRSFCVYDAPSPEAVRQCAARNQLPIDRITEVRVLDPYFYLE